MLTSAHISKVIYWRFNQWLEKNNSWRQEFLGKQKIMCNKKKLEKLEGYTHYAITNLLPISSSLSMEMYVPPKEDN